MRKLQIIFLLLLVPFLCISQTNKFYYFDKHNRLVTDTTKAVIRKELKELSEKKWEVAYALRSHTGWKENGKKEVVNAKKGNKFEITRDIYGTGFNTTIEISDTLSLGFHFKEYYGNFCFREAEALTLFPLVLKGKCTYFPKLKNEKEEHCLYWNNLKYQEIYYQLSTSDSTKIPEVFPQYPGGANILFDDISSLTHYPNNLNLDELSDTALISIIINEKGKISDAKTIKSLHPSVDSCFIEAILKLKSPWIAAISNQQFAPFEYVLPFSLSKRTKKNNDAGRVFISVEQMPSYPGGEEALRKDITSNIRYPIEAQKKGIEGKVFVGFIVDTTGFIKDVKVVRGVHPALNMEATRVVKSLKQWIPGMQKGEKVCVSYTVPINFVLGRSNATFSRDRSAW